MKLKLSSAVLFDGSAKNHLQSEQIKQEIKQSLFEIPNYQKLVDDFFIIKGVCNKVEEYSAKLKQLKISKKQFVIDIIREVFPSSDSTKVGDVIENLCLN